MLAGFNRETPAVRGGLRVVPCVARGGLQAVIQERKLAGMRSVVLCLYALFLCMPANCQTELLKADLLSPSRSSGSQAADHIMLLAEKTHEPQRSEVEWFASDLIASLATIRSLSPAILPKSQADAIVAEIDSVLKSAGTSTVGFRDHIVHFETIMFTAGTPRWTARRLASQLELIGRQVRGPEDTPVRPRAIPQRR